jgi:ribonucleoside-diphosphate reductase alpha chain
MQMLKLIVEQLQGIGGSRSVGMGPMRVMSLPDAVAGALMKQYLSEEKAQQMTLFNGGNGNSSAHDEVASDEIAVQAAHDHDHDHEHDYANDSSNGYLTNADMCPSCGTISLIRVEGCRKCLTCGYSEC